MTKRGTVRRISELLRKAILWIQAVINPSFSYLNCKLDGLLFRYERARRALDEMSSHTAPI
jgi:uncharacterized protein YjiS (DUF1127 family)